MRRRNARWAVAAAVAGIVALLAGIPAAQATTVVLTVPNAIVVTTWHSWCGGTRIESRQINGRFQKGTPTVYVYRDRTTWWCILPTGHRHPTGHDHPKGGGRQQ